MKIKTIIALVSAVVVVSAMSVAAFWASHRPDPSPCAWFRVEITDSLDRRFVESDELRRLIAREGLLPEGQPMDEISCQAIEDCLLKHDMVRTAECFKTYQGGVRVRVTQRVPALYVMSSEGAYYVDKDRQIMPVRRTIEVDVPTFKGAVGKRAATEEYFDFAKWISSDRYWHSRIQHVQVVHPKYLVLHQEDGMGKIILGDLSQYEQKLDKLQKVYIKEADYMNDKNYREFDLRYKGQVIGRK